MVVGARLTERNYRMDCKFCGKPLVPLERGIYIRRGDYRLGYWEHRDEDYENCPQVIRERKGAKPRSS